MAIWKKIFREKITKKQKEQGEKSLYELMSSYKEEINFDGSKITSPWLIRLDRKEKINKIYGK